MLIGWLEAVEIGSFVGFLKWKERQKVKDDLYSRHKRPRELPLIDGYVKPLAGSPTKMHRAAAQKIAAVVRYVASTRAFEYLLMALVNPKSKLRVRMKNEKIREVAITL